MPSYLDFESSRKGGGLNQPKNGFRDFLLGRTLKQPNGPQTFTKSSYEYQKLSDIPNIDLGTVENDRNNTLIGIQTSNTYKPEAYFIRENLDTLPRKYNLSLYFNNGSPYFVPEDHNLIGIMATQSYENESELFKFAANYIRTDKNGPVLARIAANANRETLGRVRIFDALQGNSTAAINIITGREPLIGPNYAITVAKTLPGKAIDFLEKVGGITLPVSEIPGDYLSNPSNPINYRPEAKTEVGKAWQDVTGALGSLIGIQRRPTRDRKPSDLLIEYMGQGQTNRLYDALTFNKYAPNYTTTARSQNTSKIFSFVDKVAQGIKNILGVEAPAGKAYIGDDRGDSVNAVMNDFNGRPVFGSYYLGVKFDKTAAELFQVDKNISQGGLVSGNLTWYGPNSQLKVDGNNKVSKTLSTNFSGDTGFRPDSILGITQEILNSGAGDRTHVSNVINQTTRVFQEGDIKISRGSAIKYTNKYNSDESGMEYCRVWTKDRSYSTYAETMKRTNNVRKYDDSILGGKSRVWNMNIAPMSNGKKSFDGSSNIVERNEGRKDFYAKKYMFSIENLAWKASNRPGFTVGDLPYCERGRNGGRVMWFPPYDLKINEQNNANWDKNSFLGRPEPIYTYQDTERSGTLSFKVIVDHPSILNLLVREHFKDMSDEQADNYINAFFAGCQDVDFYNLIQTYTTLDREDVTLIQQYLNAGTTKETIDKFKYTSEDVVIENPSADTTPSPNTEPIEFNSVFYFDNDIPKGKSGDAFVNTNYQSTYDSYIASKDQFIANLTTDLGQLITGNTVNDHIDQITIFGKSGSTLNSSNVNEIVNVITSGFTNLTTTYTDFATKITNLKKDITDKKVSEVKLDIFTTTSEVASNKYNFYLGLRRAYSLFNDFSARLVNSTEKKQPTFKQFSKEFLAKYSKNGLPKMGDTIMTIPFKDFGFDVDGNVIASISTLGEDAVLKEAGGSQNVDCSKVINKKNGLKITAPIAFFCRQSNIKFTYDKTKEEIPQKENIPLKKIKVEPDTETITVTKPKPNIDVMKRIIMKTLSECYYFKQLEETSPLIFDSMREKLKYFHPAFHSMTPEGLNSRLNFLLQCVRPGDTIPVKGLSDKTDLNARNTAFGPPPICVLRIGDFYHSKVIVKDVNISYEDSPWDMNPEGIGMQPMIASVTMQLNFIGGQGIERPVEKLQNALSSNFFANTEMYDERSTSTALKINNKDAEEFTKEFLTDLSKKPEFELITELTGPNKDNVIQGEYMGILNGNKIDYTDMIDYIYRLMNVYTESYKLAFSDIVRKYSKKLVGLFLSPTYRTIDTLDVTGGPSVKLIGLFKSPQDISLLIDNFKNTLDIAIDNTNLTRDLFGMFDSFELEELYNQTSEEFLKGVIKDLVGDKIDQMYKFILVKSLEHERNEFIRIFDKLNFIHDYNHDVMISGDTYTQATLSGYAPELFYNEYKTAVEFLNTFNAKVTAEIDNTLDFGNFDTLAGQLQDIDILKEIIFPMIKDSKIKIVDPYTLNDVFTAEAVQNVDQVFDFQVNLNTYTGYTFTIDKSPKRPNTKKVEYEIIATTEMTDDAEGLIVNKIFINKGNGPENDKLNYYEP